MTGKAITAAIDAHREALAPLAGVPWRQGRKDPCQVWAATDEDYLKHVWVSHFVTPELAAEACASHNAALDLAWLTEAGYLAELERLQGHRWRVSLRPRPDGWTALCGQGNSPGEALAKARQWAEGRERA